MGTLLLTSGLLATTEAEVTCIEKTVHAISNPSFETGDLTDWTSLVATGAPSRGTVIADDSVDGEYHLYVHPP